MQKYMAGDMGRVPPTTFISKMATGVMNCALTPHCDFFHHFTIRTYIPDEDDYEIKEAVGSGMKDGRLSWYKNYEIYRNTDPDLVEFGELACAKYSRFGRYGYDYKLIPKILWGFITVEVRVVRHEHHFRKLHPAELPYALDHEFVCTESAYEISYLQAKLAHKPGAAILPSNVISIPTSIQGVINAGAKLVRVQG